MTTFTWYTDPALTASVPPADGDGDRIVTVPVPDSMRPAAGPLTLPDTAEATCYRSTDDGTIRAWRVSAQLDPASNHGWASAWFSLFHQAGRGFDVQVTAGDRAGILTTCPACESPWALATQQAWSNDTDCPDCGYGHATPIGD